MVGGIDLTAKEDFLASSKPLTSKMGSHGSSMVAGPAAIQLMKECISSAQKLNLSYLRMPYVFDLVGQKTYEEMPIFDSLISLIIKAGIIPIVPFQANYTTVPSGLVPDSYVSFMQTEAEKVIKNNANKGIVWEAFNEASGIYYWSASGETDQQVIKQWVTFDNYLYDLVRKYDNDSPFLGLSGDTGYINYVDTDGTHQPGKGKFNGLLKSVKDYGGLDKLDGLSLHPYIKRNLLRGNPEAILNEYQNDPSELIKGIPMVPTEFGYSIKADNTTAVWQGTFTNHEARSFGVRQMFLFDLLGCPAIIVHNLHHREYGLSSNYALNSVGEAYKWYLDRLKGYTLQGRLAITDYTATSVFDDFYALKYTKKGSKDLMVYWSPIPNRYATVATAENVTNSLWFSDMPQIRVI